MFNDIIKEETDAYSANSVEFLIILHLDVIIHYLYSSIKISVLVLELEGCFLPTSVLLF